MVENVIAPSFDGSQLCAKGDPEIFFPESPDIPLGLTAEEKRALKLKHAEDLRRNVERAKTICKQCKFIEPCLEYALKHDVVGVWAATTKTERKTIIKERGLPNPRSMALFMDSAVK